MNLLTRWTNKTLFLKCISEFIGCMIFHFIGSVSPTPWANGLILIVMVYFTAKISGAHLNPSVTLTFAILGYTNPIEILVYWFSQISGCIIGAYWLLLLMPPEPRVTGCFTPDPALSNASIFGWEAFCTFSFMLPIFAVVWYTYHKNGYGNTGPLVVGLSLIGNALAAGPYTGAALNPARVLGSVFVFECPKNKIVYYILGEICAALLVPLVIFPFYGLYDKSWYFDLGQKSKAKIWLQAQEAKRRNPKSIEIKRSTDFCENGSSGTPRSNDRSSKETV